MKYPSEAKSARLLAIYLRLSRGETLGKHALSTEYHMTLRSVQRDMESLRCFIAEQYLEQDIVYDHRQQGYHLVNTKPTGLTNSEILAVCKILLESRSLRKDEMLPILHKLLDCCVPVENRTIVNELILNESHLYIEPQHKQPLLQRLWLLGQAVHKRRVLAITYRKMGGADEVKRVIEPVGLLFSEFYFYLVAFIRDIDRAREFENPDDLFPTIYRVDRILTVQETELHFSPQYAARFQEGEFRKRIQFMYGGKLQTARFTYTGPSVEAVLDRLPTAEIIAKKDGAYTIRAEVFGKGIDMWLRSQGDYIRKGEYASCQSAEPF